MSISPSGVYGTQAFSYEEKVSPVRTLVTDVVENVRNSPERMYKEQYFSAHHISQKSVAKSRFLTASPPGEAFFL